jgi:hypothetical protein
MDDRRERAEARVALTMTIDRLAEAWVLAACGELDYGECGAFPEGGDSPA